MLLVVGLGNPGSDYANNRHNIGFMAVDAIHRAHDFSMFRPKFQGLLANGTVAGEKVLLLKPETFMNESGRAVQAAMSFYKAQPKNIIVFHDELDLANRTHLLWPVYPVHGVSFDKHCGHHVMTAIQVIV